MPALRFTIMQPPSEIRWSVQEPGFSTEILHANATEDGGNNRTLTMMLFRFQGCSAAPIGKDQHCQHHLQERWRLSMGGSIPETAKKKTHQGVFSIALLRGKHPWIYLQSWMPIQSTATSPKVCMEIGLHLPLHK